MAQTDLFMREDPSHKGDVSRYVYILDSVPDNRSNEIIEEGKAQIESQYGEAKDKNFSTKFSQKNFAKLVKAWEEQGCQQVVVKVSRDVLDAVSFHLGLEDVPMSFYTPESDYIVAGPFYESTLKDAL